MSLCDQPIVYSGNLYIKGMSGGTASVLEYTPGFDQWAELPPTPVSNYTLATLKSQLLIVGGEDHTEKKSNTVLMFKERPKRWVQAFPAMPIALTFPTVCEHQDHLIVAGGLNSNNDEVADVNILDAVSNKINGRQPNNFPPQTTTSFYCLKES